MLVTSLEMPAAQVGEEMYDWCRHLWPMPRSLTGPGVRQTLDFLGELLPGLRRSSVPSGTSVGDWMIPDEWAIRAAWIDDMEGHRIVDFVDNNLHVVGYSVPVDTVMSAESLRDHLHWLPDQPNAVPYITSYYERTWGFCVTAEQFHRLQTGEFRVVIDSSLTPGVLDFADLVLPGRTPREVMFSTYVCHPSLANNELSGPVVTAALARWVASLPDRTYTYRFIFAPETIGAITYLHRHLEELRSCVDAGWVVTCVGDDRAYSYLPSRGGSSLADRISERVIARLDADVDRYPWSSRGSDERQWCAPGVDLPVCSLMRSKYGTYPEYHTSADDLNLVTPSGLQGGLEILARCVLELEGNRRPRVTTVGEPHMSSRNLYPTLSSIGSATGVRSMMDVLSHSDGTSDACDVAGRCGLTVEQVDEIWDVLSEYDLVRW